jgi:hypothetical protein
VEVTCYACNDPASTVEHVPPRGFFPPGKRLNLITVPSCRAHNNDLSKDVEYVRNLAPLVVGTNEVGLRQFTDKVMRSYERSPALKAQTFKNMQEVRIGGQPAGLLTVEVDRVIRIMEGVARGLHYRDTGQKQWDWVIIPASMMHRENIPAEAKRTWKQLLTLFDSVKLADRQCSNPEVFTYASGSNPSPTVGTYWYYRLCFYGGFTIKAVTLPKKG